MTRPLSRVEKAAFGSGDVAVNISMMSVSLLLTFFYTDVFGLEPVHMAWLFLVVRLIDAVTDPLMGIITDRIVTGRGRYRHWIGLSAVPFGFSVYLMFTAPELSYEGKVLWAYGTYIFNSLMFTMVTIPYISLISVITDSPSEKLSANAWRFVMAKGAVLFVTSCLTALATWLGDGNLAAGFGAAMAMMAMLSTLALFICYRGTTEQLSFAPDRTPVTIQLKHIVLNDQWRVLAVACVLIMTGYLVRSSIAFHYATYFLGIDSGDIRFALFMSLWAVGGIAATIVSSQLTRRYCKLAVFRNSLYLAAMTGVLMYFSVSQGDIYLGMLYYFLLCFFSDINTPIFWSSVAEVVDYGEREQGVRVSGLSFGSFSFLQKLGMGIAGLMVGLLLEYFAYNPGPAQSEFTLNGISLMISVIPAAFFFLTAFVMQRYIISNEYYRQMNPGVSA